jgi:hypothetical protein
MITLPEIERKQNLLKDYAEKYRLNFRKHFSKISALEGIVARGDRRIAQIIYNAWKGGARFDGWDETFNYNLWVKCVEESGIDTQIFLGTIPMNGKLAWDHIDVGLTENKVISYTRDGSKEYWKEPIFTEIIIFKYIYITGIQ